MLISVAGYVWSTTEDCKFTNQMLKEYGWIACLFKTRKENVKYNYSEIIKDVKRLNDQKNLGYSTLNFVEDYIKIKDFIEEYNKNNKLEYSIIDLKVEEV